MHGRYLYVLKARKSASRIDMCKYVQYVETRAYIDTIRTQIRSNICKYIQNTYIFLRVQKSTYSFLMFIWQVYVRIFTYIYILGLAKLRAYTY